jgi:hypothetical protein
MKEQIQQHARKHIKVGCYLKVTLGHRGLRVVKSAVVKVYDVKIITGIKI